MTDLYAMTEVIRYLAPIQLISQLRLSQCYLSCNTKKRRNEMLCTKSLCRQMLKAITTIAIQNECVVRYAQNLKENENDLFFFMKDGRTAVSLYVHVYF